MRLEADYIGPLEIFKIGVGPSSSHTVGPMVAALAFRDEIGKIEKSLQGSTLKLVVELFGSLSATGLGHGTDGALCAGLVGLHPRFSSTEDIWAAMPELNKKPLIDVSGLSIEFLPERDILWQNWTLDDRALPHPNTMTLVI